MVAISTSIPLGGDVLSNSSYFLHSFVDHAAIESFKSRRILPFGHCGLQLSGDRQMIYVASRRGRGTAGAVTFIVEFCCVVGLTIIGGVPFFAGSYVPMVHMATATAATPAPRNESISRRVFDASQVNSASIAASIPVRAGMIQSLQPHVNALW